MWVIVYLTYLHLEITVTKGTMDPEGSAHNSCNSWPLYAFGKFKHQLQASDRSWSETGGNAKIISSLLEWY